MNAVEIEQAVSAIAEQPFEAAEFAFAFLRAFGNKETTLKKLRKGDSNKSDLGGVLQTNNIHIAIAPAGEVTRRLGELKASPATVRFKAKFVAATDGENFEAENLISGDTVEGKTRNGILCTLRTADRCKPGSCSACGVVEKPVS